MTRALAALALALLLAGCSGFKGSPHGYGGVGAGSSTGISARTDGAGVGPSVSLGTQEGRFAVVPFLNGDGMPIDPPPSVMTCFETEARTGARVVSYMAMGAAAAEAAKRGCSQ